MTTLALLLAAVFWSVIIGLVAKQKNLNPWNWAIAGVLAWPIALLILVFLPAVCPKCDRDLTRKQGTEKVCPVCGPFAETSRSSGVGLGIKQSGIATLRKFQSAPRPIRASVVFSLLWVICVAAYVSLFAPYGAYVTEDEYYHMFKVMVFPPIVGVVSLFLYKKFVAFPGADTTGKGPNGSTS